VAQIGGSPSWVHAAKGYQSRGGQPSLWQWTTLGFSGEEKCRVLVWNSREGSRNKMNTRAAKRWLAIGLEHGQSVLWVEMATAEELQSFFREELSMLLLGSAGV